ncbi:MAG: flagellar protein FlgN [Lachnospiraceae bacterium]|nr:flagellar protein FlgN [Lachnospiraceae bacterium]
MASLMEELISVLGAEQEIYEKLIPISEKKTLILIKEDLEELKKVTAEEQFLIDKVSFIDRKREEIIKNIGIVLNKDPKELDLNTLSKILAKQPEEKKAIANMHDSLRKTMKRLVEINEKNKSLIENSLEMIEFNMNFIQSTRMSTGGNNYDRNATTSYNRSINVGGFDAKQ